MRLSNTCCGDVVGKRSLQAVVSRSDSDKCVTRLVGQMTSLSLDELTIRRIGISGGSTLGPGGTGPPNLAKAPKFFQGNLGHSSSATD